MELVLIVLASVVVGFIAGALVVHNVKNGVSDKIDDIKVKLDEVKAKQDKGL